MNSIDSFNCCLTFPVLLIILLKHLKRCKCLQQDEFPSCLVFFVCTIQHIVFKEQAPPPVVLDTAQCSDLTPLPIHNIQPPYS